MKFCFRFDSFYINESTNMEKKLQYIDNNFAVRMLL